jgi:hypothetical protein
MLHAQIRTAVRGRLTELHGGAPATVLRDEMGLCLGATRVDVAAINGSLTGCEIKGSRDRLTRLPHQVDLYGQVLDYAVLVVEPKFAPKASASVPDWWGLWQVQDVDDDVELTELRQPRQNPGTVPLSVAQLLWRDEVYDELTLRDAARGLAKATRWRMWEALVELLEPDELAAVVRERLKARQEWPGG